MPVYEYECPECGEHYERRVGIAVRDEQFCRECGNQLALLPSVPAWFPPGKYGKGGGR